MAAAAVVYYVNHEQMSTVMVSATVGRRWQVYWCTLSYSRAVVAPAGVQAEIEQSDQALPSKAEKSAARVGVGIVRRALGAGAHSRSLLSST
jgi:hypothetical protein